MMTTKEYVLGRVDGSVTTIYEESDGEAILAAIGILGHDVVAAEQWDSDGSDDDGQPLKRILFWESEEDAQNDDGSRAIAALSTGGTA